MFIWIDEAMDNIRQEILNLGDKDCKAWCDDFCEYLDNT